ncbi:hypothetical protein BDZ85DRAFT_258329 [Elsinoe ampelina]|uniref:Uncharacterized protein n=1 Tax=Elsinoe ampelina TaxID=302913 RepID=A0A6A6GKB9_9PEZI|nr:hypothetical protein BDZ85DRAFT_258329 [Elsinoe ampelina]
MASSSPISTSSLSDALSGMKISRQLQRHDLTMATDRGENHESEDEQETTPNTSFGPVTSCPTPPIPDLTSSSSPSSSASLDIKNVTRTTKAITPSTSPLAIHAALFFQAASTKLPGSTIALDLAKRNLIDADHLRSGALYDPADRPLIFVTGVLQLPGTLNAALGHWDRSELKLVKCMTPGRVMLRTDGADQNKSVVYSDVETSVAGMVVFGRGKENRRMLSEWHGEKYLRVLVEVQVQTEDWVKRRFPAFTWVEKRALGWDIDSDESSQKGSGESDMEDGDGDGFGKEAGGDEKIEVKHAEVIDEYMVDGQVLASELSIE